MRIITRIKPSQTHFKILKEIIDLASRVQKLNLLNLNADDRKLLNDVIAMRPLMEKFIETFNNLDIGDIPKKKYLSYSSKRTISEVIDIMLLKANNCHSEQIRKKNSIIFMLKKLGLSPKDDYSKFHTSDVIEKLSRLIVSLETIKGDTKRRYLRYIKELANCGNNINPERYKYNVILNLPNIEKTKRADKKPHQPYSKQQLLKIFNPRYDHFKKHPDAFWVCMIALFTGARANSAITLQYNDICKKEGIYCIHFIENHKIKQLKNEASERVVPIHPQLLQLGFVSYVQRQQKTLRAKGTDFIFPKCQSKNGLYNNKYTLRYILKFFLEIGVKSASYDGYDFHSLRKNASIAMQDAHIPVSYINDIIGWEGQNTMEQSYSNHTIKQIFSKISKFDYGFLNHHFIKWQEIMEKI